MPTLKIFPWFSFHRLSERSTVIYPLIFSLFALNINLSSLKPTFKAWVFPLLIILACVEVYTFYGFKLNYHPMIYSENFFSYMNYVKQQPGEAILDWPFCVHGGDNVGGDSGLCPLYAKNASIFALRRFHGKKVMGQYFGRLHPSQLEEYLEAGWQKLLVADNPNIFKATRLAYCFSAKEWEFFTNFYLFNDFAGINLYSDLLPQGCVNEFHARLGNPQITTTIPWLGKVEFIQKNAEQRRHVNRKLGVELKLMTFD